MCPTAIENTPDGRRLVVTRAIDVPPERVWAVLTDTRRWPEWGPSVAAVECSDRFIEAGSCGHIRTTGLGTLLGRPSLGSLRVSFRVTDCDEYRWTWTVSGLRATGHRVEPTEKGCLVSFEIPPLAVAYAPVCRRALADIEYIVRATG